jgi:predicted transcriptional regulator
METILNKKYSAAYGVPTFNATIFDKRYRSSFEIVALILKTADKGVSRFAMAKRLKTNYSLLHKYLNYLIRIGFIDIEFSGKQILYKTTKKGFEFLRIYHNLLKILSNTVEANMPINIVCSKVTNMS